MLFILFKLGNDRYALDASRVVEVVPLLNIQKLAGSPPGVAGVFNYRGQFVTAVDLCELMLQRPCESRLSTRIILVKNPGADGTKNLLGFIVEEATGTLRKDRSDFQTAPAGPTGNPVGLPAHFDPQGAIHLLDENHLLSDSLRNQLAHVAH